MKIDQKCEILPPLDHGGPKLNLLISIVLVKKNHFENCQKIRNMTPLTVMEFSKHFKSLQFLMVQGSLNPNITFLGVKLCPVA